MDILAYMKLGAAVAAGIFVMVIWHKWEANAEAARQLPIVQKKLDSEEKDALDLAGKLAKETARREQAERDFAGWQGIKAPLIDAIKEGGRHAVASTNKICLPNADDRRMRNQTLERLLGTGQDPDAARVPSRTSGAPHPLTAPAVRAHG